MIKQTPKQEVMKCEICKYKNNFFTALNDIEKQHEEEVNQIIIGCEVDKKQALVIQREKIREIIVNKINRLESERNKITTHNHRLDISMKISEFDKFLKEFDKRFGK